MNSYFLGWLICSSTKKEGIYYSGDSARLHDRVYQEIRQNLPEIFINIQPGGPNRKHEDLASTHQSLPEGIETHFRLSHSQDKKIFSEQVKKMKTIIIHHNTFEFGLDCFNDNLRLWRQMILHFEGHGDANNKDFLVLASNVLDHLSRYPLDEGAILEILKKHIVFPKIGESFPLE